MCMDADCFPRVVPEVLHWYVCKLIRIQAPELCQVPAAAVCSSVQLQHQKGVTTNCRKLPVLYSHRQLLQSGHSQLLPSKSCQLFARIC